MTPGDVYWVELPAATGHEQAGRRPGIVLQEDSFAGNSPLVFIVPLTTTLSVSRFTGTVTVEPTSENGLTRTSLALVFQLRATDRNRIRDKIGFVTAEVLTEIFVKLDQMMGR